MKIKLTPVAAAAAVALAGAVAPALAQQAAPAPSAAASSAASDVQQVEVKGIRGSLQQSLSQKRAAETHVEVITAEDIGKLPDKNVADSLQHVPGITISSAGANEGGFDESDRVSMRGTSPSLTQTLINGHSVSSGDWFVLDQVTTVGRSVSYTLLPSEVVSSVVVHKTSQASLVEGGVAGSVDIITRKPLDFRKQFTAQASLGAVYSDLPGETDPQANALFNWKNEAGTLGVMVQGFYERRHLRRDGVESLGYEQIDPASAMAQAHPDLAGVWYPQSSGAAFFEQDRKRTGGLIDLQIAPNTDTKLDFNYFYSKLDATNYNRNYLLWGTHFINQGNTSCTPPAAGSPAGTHWTCVGQAPDAGYVVRNNTLVSATFSPTMAVPGQPGAIGDVQHGIYDQISRPDEGATSQFFAFDGDFRLSNNMKLKTSIGSTYGVGKTPEQDVMEFDLKGTGGAYALNGVNTAPDFSLPGGIDSAPNSNTALDWIFGDQNVKQTDKEQWAQADATYAIDMGPLVELKFGGRGTSHKREQLNTVAQGPLNDAQGNSPFDPANWPQGYQNYPGNFGENLGGSFPRNVWYYTPDQLAAFDAQFTNRDPVTRRYFPHEFSLHESTAAGYLQGNLEGDKWSGDVGLRLVNTTENVMTFQPAQATTPGAITTSLFGPFVPVTTNHSYTDVLPSGNLKLELSKDLLARFALSRTMTRPDYSAIAGTVNLTPPAVAGGQGSGTGGNPDLKPITSNNADVSLEWYFAPRSLLSASLFYMDLTSYVGYGHVEKTYITYDANNPNGAPVDYLLTVPVNTGGKVKGIELAWEQPVWGNFGANANYTYSDASEDGGGPLVGASKNTYNVGAYFENDMFNARVTYNYRSSFYSGLDRSTAFYQDSVGTLSAALGWQVTKGIRIDFQARNLNDPKLRYYALNKDQPRAIYQNGRQYYLSANFEY